MLVYVNDRPGLGQAPQQIVVPAVSTGLTVATPFIAKAISTAAWSVPVVGAAVAGVTLALQAFFNRKGPRQREAATQMVNELEQQLQANKDAYFAGPRTRASQAVALQNFDDGWAWLHSDQGCGNPALGDPGRACREDRSRSGPWPWEVYYRDPIANDSEVKDDMLSSEVLNSVLPGMTALDWRSALPVLGVGLIVLAAAAL